MKELLPLELLKINAPKIYVTVKARAVHKLMSEINALRVAYVRESDPIEKSKIADQAKFLKADLERYI